jgi:hypothetical protein
MALPTPTREGFNFLGWFTLQSNGVQVTGAYTPSATATLWAHWIQKSLVGVGNSQKIGTITTLANVGNTYSATSTSGTVAVTYVANALPVGTVIDIYQMADSSRASSMISSADQYVLSLVIAWLTPTNTVPILSSNDALTMVITDSAIKKGAKVYSLVGSDSTLLGTATVDGSVTVKILEDPEVYIAISKPDAPTGVSATTGGSRSSTVSWIAPSTDGGSAITYYTATSNLGQFCTSGSTSCLVTGLNDATTYTFTVTATNAVGVSIASAPSAAILTEDTAGLALVAQQAEDARVAAAALAAQQAAAALAAQQAAAAALAAQQAAAAALAAQQAAAALAAQQAAAALAAQQAAATLSSLTFTDDGTGAGGRLNWSGVNINAVLYTGPITSYPGQYNYGTFTSTWDGRIINLTPDTSYTISIYAITANGNGELKSLTFKTNAVKKLDENDLGYWKNWLDIHTLTPGEASSITKQITRFDALKASSRLSYVRVPTSRVLKISAKSLTPNACSLISPTAKVNAGLVTAHTQDTCTISYTVTGRSKKAVTMTKDFVFKKVS